MRWQSRAERDQVFILLSLSYLLVQEMLNKKTPNVNKAESVVQKFRKTVFQLPSREDFPLTAADSSLGTLNGSLQGLLGPSWVLEEGGHAPEERGSCLSRGRGQGRTLPPYYLHLFSLPWQPFLSP